MLARLICEILAFATRSAPTTNAEMSTAPMSNATKNLFTNARNDNGDADMGVASDYRRDTAIRAHPGAGRGLRAADEGVERVAGVGDVARIRREPRGRGRRARRTARGT